MCSQEFKLSPKKVSQLRYTLSILVINKNSSNNIKTCTDKKKRFQIYRQTVYFSAQNTAKKRLSCTSQSPSRLSGRHFCSGSLTRPRQLFGWILSVCVFTQCFLSLLTKICFILAVIYIVWFGETKYKLNPCESLLPGKLWRITSVPA